jgi:hypothetical protein
MMQELRGEERWAKTIIQDVLGVPAEQHDDGSAPGMYDLDVMYPDRPWAAVEIVAAADAESIQTWKLMNGKGEGQRWVVEDLQGGWLVSILPSASAKGLWKRLPGLLAELECQGVRRLAVEELAVDVADELGVIEAWQSATDYPGSIYVTIEQTAERSGGAVPDTGNVLAKWVGQFLLEPRHGDVLRKLGRSNASEKHAFVIVPGLTTAPFAVADLLMRSGAPIPVERPVLPAPVTHVWIVSTWNSGVGFRWSQQEGWETFEKP